MNPDAAIRDKEMDRHNTTHSASEGPLRKKKSLTRLFTRSRSSSRSRPPSPEDEQVPTTPTIPEQYLSTARKASGSETSATSSNNPEHLVQLVLADVTNTTAVISELSDPRTQGLRGILKPQIKALKIHCKIFERENPVTPINPISIRPGSTRVSNKRPKDKSLTYRSPTGPRIGKTAVGGTVADGPTSPSTRNRGASTASLALSRSRNSPIKARIPSRPSTSGGEPRAKQKEDRNIVREGSPGLGLRLGPFSEPTGLNDTEARSSFRSAVASDPSVVGASTARSSVVTKDTSVSDVTIDSPPKDTEDEGMTVDEAIGMYAKGFVDDIDSDHEHASNCSTSEEERRRSTKIAEALNDTIGPDTAPLGHTSMPTFSEAATASFNELMGHESQGAPPVILPTRTRDQYGFLKVNRYITGPQYDTWNNVYASEQVRRTKKWYQYMLEQGCSTSTPTRFPDRGPKTVRYVRKGIPPSWRGNAWFYYSGGAKMLDENPDTYPSLLSRRPELSSNDAESIERDLHRTFPDNIHFKPDQVSNPGIETPLLSSLRRVLQAFAIYRPQIGYCQSLNFLAGLLLLFLPEEKTFWMLHMITTNYLPGTHEISLEGANVDLWVLMLALKESSPSIWAKVGVGDEDASSIHTARLPPISLCTTSWFMSMFIGTLPIESVLRVWDVIFYEGSKILFRIALAIFKMEEQRIKDVTDTMELFQVVQSFPRGILDIGALMGVACRRGIGIDQEWITKKRQDRRKWTAMGKAQAPGPASPINAGDSPITKSTPSLSRANSAWRRRVGLVK